MGNTDLDDLLPRNILQFFLLLLLTSPSHFLLAVELLLEGPSNIANGLPRLKECLDPLEISNYFLLSNGILEYLEVLGPYGSGHELLVHFLVLGRICAIHASR